MVPLGLGSQRLCCLRGATNDPWLWVSLLGHWPSGMTVVRRLGLPWAWNAPGVCSVDWRRRPASPSAAQMVCFGVNLRIGALAPLGAALASLGPFLERPQIQSQKTCNSLLLSQPHLVSELTPSLLKILLYKPALASGPCLQGAYNLVGNAALSQALHVQEGELVSDDRWA